MFGLIVCVFSRLLLVKLCRCYFAVFGFWICQTVILFQRHGEMQGRQPCGSSQAKGCVGSHFLVAEHPVDPACALPHRCGAEAFTGGSGTGLREIWESLKLPIRLSGFSPAKLPCLCCIQSRHRLTQELGDRRPHVSHSAEICRMWKTRTSLQKVSVPVLIGFGSSLTAISRDHRSQVGGVRNGNFLGSMCGFIAKPSPCSFRELHLHTGRALCQEGFKCPAWRGLPVLLSKHLVPCKC